MVSRIGLVSLGIGIFSLFPRVVSPGRVEYLSPMCARSV